MAAAAAARATAADTSIITHGGAGWARRGAGHWAGGRLDDGREKEREREKDRERERTREKERMGDEALERERRREAREVGGGRRRGGGGTEEEEEEERGVSGQPGSSRATRRKPRYHPPSTPRLPSSKRPCHPSLPPLPLPAPLFLHAYLPRCPPPRPIQTSAALLPSLPSSRKGCEGWWLVGVGGQPPPARRSALTHAPQPRARPTTSPLVRCF